jgi:hypothetical protein
MLGSTAKIRNYVNILLSNDNLLFEAYGVVGNACYYSIQYIGPEIDFSQFKYKFLLESGQKK